MDIYHIYKITHRPTNQCYIGVSLDPTRRYKQHQQKKNGSLINEALQQFPLDEFEYEVLCCTADRHYAYWELEPIFIKDHSTHITQGGFNRTYGGGYAGPKLFNEAHKEKLRLAQTGKQLSKETKQKMSDSARGKPKPWKSKPLPDWHKKLFSDSLKGKPSKRRGRKFGRVAGTKQYTIRFDQQILTTDNLFWFCKEHNVSRSSALRTLQTGRPTRSGLQIIHVQDAAGLL